MEPDQHNTDQTSPQQSEDKDTQSLEAQAPTVEPPGRSKKWLTRFKHWYTSRKKWSIPLSILLVIIILAAVPISRYKIAGLALKRNFSVNLIDSESGSPVSGATVSVGTMSAQTDGAGRAVLHLSVGPHKFNLSKKYYQNLSTSLTVPILAQKGIPSVKLVATGRQVSLTITNLISKQPLSGVKIDISGVQALTGKDGSALLVVPANLTSAQAALSLPGYNSTTAQLKISDQKVEQNSATMTPAGSVYFLSKLSGTIDVVKTNLDGTNRKTVLAGTGQESDTGTVLLASRDWKYLALLAQRGTQTASLYAINTSNDKLLDMDSGNATFTPVGWYNHYFVYTVARNGYNNWQPNAFSIKSYNADTGQTIVLVNTNATGTSNADAQYENIWSTILMNNSVIYTKTWYQYPGYLQVNGKQNVLAAINVDGSNSRQIKAVDSASSYISNVKLNKPNQLYFGVYSNGVAGTAYYSLDSSGTVSSAQGVSDQTLTTPANSYLLSPSGTMTFWAEERDGKNSLFVGDQNGGGAQQIASLSDFSAYGWYGDNYLLVSKGGSELYILPRAGIKSDADAIKITDYHKPQQDIYGYGGGYGGL